MAQARDLVPHGLDDPRVAVPDGGGEDAGEQVEVLPTVGAPGPHALGFHEHQRLVVQRLHAWEDGGALALDQFPRYHRVITTRLSVKNSTESRPWALRSPKKEPRDPPKGKKAIGAATPMLMPIMLMPA